MNSRFYRFLCASALLATALAACAQGSGGADDPERAFDTDPIVRAKVEELAGKLSSGDELDAMDACTALGEIGRPAVGALTAALGAEKPGARVSAALALVEIGPDAGEAVPKLIESLQSQVGELRSAAASALGKIGADREAALPALRAALADKDNRVALAAAVAVLDFAPEDTAAAKLLLDALQAPPLRQTAAEALGGHLAVVRGGVDAVAAALASEDRNVRSNVSEALAALGPDGAKAVPALLRVVDADPDAFVRVEAIRALGKIGAAAAAAEPHLAALLSQSQAPLSAEARARLEEAAKVLHMAAGDGSVNLAVAACTALLSIQPEHAAARAVLAATMHDATTKWWDRIEAAESLARLGVEKDAALDLLRTLLADPDRRAQSDAAHALARLGRAEGAAALAEDLTFDNSIVRAKAAAALERLGPAAKAALPALETAAKSPFDARLRKAARAALRAVKG